VRLLETTTGYAALTPKTSACSMLTKGDDMTDNDESKRFHARMFWLQSAARAILIGNRVGACCRIVVPGQNVQVWGDVARRKAKYRNVVRCASVWVCPVCANNITAHRRNDVQFVIDKLHGQTIPIMISFTLRHSRQDGLLDTLTTLTDAWRRMTSCKRWSLLKRRGHLKGYVRALEVTWGESAGWHPHFHVLFFLTPEACISQFFTETRQWWEESVKLAGGTSAWEHACFLTVADGSIAEYVTKWGHAPKEETIERLNNWGKARELTRSGMKAGRGQHLTPFDMLEAFLANGNPAPGYWGKLIREYAEAIHGNRQLTWSRNPDLRAEAGLDMEKSENEIVEGEEAGYYLLATINQDDWRAILYAGEQGNVLDCAARGDLDMMRAIITDCREEKAKELGHRVPLTGVKEKIGA